MKKYIILVMAVVLQMCLGATYSWSVFKNLIAQINPSVSNSDANMPFTVFFIAFPTMVLFSAKLLQKFGPRLCAMVGGGLFGLGWLVGAFSEGNMWLTTLGVGLLGGIGVGIAYLIPISVGISWFPNHRGLVTGATVAGFGGSAIIAGELCRYMTTADASAVYSVIGTLGVIYFFTTIIAGYFLTYPGDYEKPKSTDKAPLHVLLQPRFIILFLAMTAGLTCGLFYTANSVQLMDSQNLTLIIKATSFFSIGNALGRVIWGWLADKFGASCMMRTNLLIGAITIVAAMTMLNNSLAGSVISVVAGLNFGGVLVLYAANVGVYWGNKLLPSIYGWVFFANVPASLIASYLGKVFEGQQQSLNIPGNVIIWSLIIIALVSLPFIKKCADCDAAVATK